MLLGLPDLAKENFENHDKSKITKHLYSLFVIVKGRQFTFSNLINSKLISELVSSDKAVFLCFYATQL